MLTYVAYVYAATNCDKLSDHPIMRSLLTVRSSFHSCQVLAQTTHPHTPAKKRGKACLERGCERMQG